MKTKIIMFFSLCILLVGCDQAQQAVVEPEANVATAESADISGANLRPYIPGLPDLKLYKLTSTGHFDIVPDGQPSQSLAFWVTVGIENIGTDVAHISAKYPIKIQFSQRVRPPAVWGQPITNEHWLRPLQAWVNPHIDRNLAPGEKISLSFHLAIKAAHLPPSRILDISCFVDATNRVVESNETNNTEGSWLISLSRL